MAPETYRSEETDMMEHHQTEYSSRSQHQKPHQHQQHRHRSKSSHHQQSLDHDDRQRKHHHHHHNGITHISANSPDAKALISRDEEWTTSKRIVNHKTRQVETRVQRQLVMEDGKVIADSGPQVITRIKEDNHTEEKENDKKPPPSKVPDGYVAVQGPHGRVLGEKKEIQRVSREVREENMQYHDERIKELTGHDVHKRALTAPNDLITLTDKKHDNYYYRQHNNGGRNNRHNHSDDDDDDDHDDLDSVAEYNNGNSSKLFSRPPRGKMVHYSAKSKKLQDSDEIHEISKLAIDGSVTKEVKRTRHHEEFSDDEQPEQDERSGEQFRSLPAATKTTERHFEYLNDYSSSSDSDSSGQQSDHNDDNHHRHNKHHHRSTSRLNSDHHLQQQLARTTTSTSHEGHVKHHKTRKEKAFPRYTIEPLVDHSNKNTTSNDNDYKRDTSTKWIKHTFEKTGRDYDYDDHDHDDRGNHHHQQSLPRQRHHSPSKSISPSRAHHHPQHQQHQRDPVQLPDEYKSSKQHKTHQSSSSHHHQHHHESVDNNKRSHKDPTTSVKSSQRYLSPEPLKRSHSPTKSHLATNSHNHPHRSTMAPKEDASVQATLTDEEDNIERRSLKSQSSVSEHSHHKSTMSLKQQSTPKSQRNYYFGEPKHQAKSARHQKNISDDDDDDDLSDGDIVRHDILADDRKYRTTPSPSKNHHNNHHHHHHHPVAQTEVKHVAHSSSTSRPASRHSETTSKSPDQIYSLSQRNKKHHTNLIIDDAPSPTPTTTGGSIRNVKTTTTTMSASLKPRRESSSSSNHNNDNDGVRSPSRSSTPKSVTVASSSSKSPKLKSATTTTKDNDKQFSVLFSPTTVKTEYKPNEAIVSTNRSHPLKSGHISNSTPTIQMPIQMVKNEQGKLRKEVLNLKQKMADIQNTNNNFYENNSYSRTQMNKLQTSPTTTKVIEIEPLPVFEARNEIHRHQLDQQQKNLPREPLIYHHHNNATSVVNVQPSEKLNADINVNEVLKEAQSSSANSDISSVDYNNRVHGSTRDLRRRQRMPAERDAVTEIINKSPALQMSHSTINNREVPTEGNNSSRIDVATTKPTSTFKQQQTKPSDEQQDIEVPTISLLPDDSSNVIIKPIPLDHHLTIDQPANKQQITNENSDKMYDKTLKQQNDDDDDSANKPYTSLGKPGAGNKSAPTQPDTIGSIDNSQASQDNSQKSKDDEDLNVAKGGQSYFLDLGTNKMLKSPSIDSDQPVVVTRKHRPYYGSPTLSSSYKSVFGNTEAGNYQPIATTTTSSKRPLSSVLASISNSRSRYPKVESYFGHTNISSSGPSIMGANNKRTRSRSSLSPFTTSPALKASKYSIYGGYKKSLYDRPSQHVPRLSYSKAIGPQKGEEKPKAQSRFLKLK